MRQAAAKPRGELRLRVLTRGEEDDVTRESIARLECDRGEPSVLVFQPRDPFRADADAVAREAVAAVAAERLTVRAHHRVAAPRPQPERQSDRVAAAAQRRDSLVAPFPSVTVRTVKHRSAVAFFEAANAGQIVYDAGRDEEKPCLFGAPIGELDAVVLVDGLRAGDADASKLDAVRRQLAPSEIVELCRRNAVARKVTMKRASRAIARLADIAKQNAAAAASQHQRRAQTRRSTSHHHHVVHLERSDVQDDLHNMRC
jgi:hypothetical protein